MDQLAVLPRPFLAGPKDATNHAAGRRPGMILLAGEGAFELPQRLATGAGLATIVIAWVIRS